MEMSEQDTDTSLTETKNYVPRGRKHWPYYFYIVFALKIFIPPQKKIIKQDFTFLNKNR